jgi:DNA-binding IclR family transcriptional regulator
MAGNSAEPGRSVTSKVVAILLTFQDGHEHSLTEIAQLTGLPVSTAHRLVTELAGWGVLERTEESQFHPGPPIRAIGGTASPSAAIIESARRVLGDLVTVAGASARLGVLAGTRVAYIEKRSDHSPVGTFAHAPRLPAHATAMGKALLAFSPAHVVDRVIAEGLTRYTPHALTDPDQLRQCLRVIRLTRVAVSHGELERGDSAAVPVFGAGGTITATLALLIPDLRTDLRMASSALTVAARGLSRELSTGMNMCRLTLQTDKSVNVRLPERHLRPHKPVVNARPPTAETGLCGAGPPFLAAADAAAGLPRGTALAT